MTDLEKEYYDKAWEAYRRLFPVFPWIADADAPVEEDFHGHYDGLDVGSTESFDSYLYSRMAELSKSHVDDEIGAITMFLSLFVEIMRGIALTLINIQSEMERGHDNITKAIDRLP